MQQQLSGSDGASGDYIAETTHFVKMLRARLHKIPQTERDEPLEFPLCEVGYSIRCIERLKQHARHNSSNYVMNLAKAIFNACRTEFSKRYSIEQAVIYLIWSVEHAEIAGIGWWKLAESSRIMQAASATIPPAYMLNKSPFRHNLAFRVSEFEKVVVAAEVEAEAKRKKHNEEQVGYVKQALHRADTSSLDREVEMMEQKIQTTARRIQDAGRARTADVRELAETVSEILDELPLHEAFAREVAKVCALLREAKIQGVFKVEDMDVGE